MFALIGSECTRRKNTDGTTDSICKSCFVTICTSTREVDLDHAERRHICDPNVLDYWKTLAEGNEWVWPSRRGTRLEIDHGLTA